MNNLRSLSGEQTADLLSPLDNIKLPEGVTLYVCRGLPQFFQRVEQSAYHSIDNSWLYIPMDVVSTVRQNLIVEASSEDGSWVGRSPVVIDGWVLYPVLIRRQVLAVLAAEPGGFRPTDRQFIDLLVSNLLRWETKAFEAPEDPAPEFIARLFRRNPDFEQFGKNLMDYMTDGLETGLGGIYFDAEGVFRLRVAVGDIGLSEYLPRDLSLSTARVWTDAMRRRQHFIPGDLLPGYPSFLHQIPNVLFVHPGIQSSRSEFLFVVATSGDLSFQDARRLERIAELGAVLHESQFSSSAALMKLFYKIGNANPAATEVVLRDLFALLNRQVGLARLVLSLPGVPSVVALKRQRGETIVESRPDEVIDPERYRETVEVSTSFCEDCAGSLTTKQLARSYYLDNVRSELCCRVMLSDGRSGVVAFGLAEPGGHLLTARDIFDTAAAFVGLSIRLASNGGQQMLPTRHAEEQRPLTPRFRTISKLATGYFHDIMQLMSVVLGHAEIIEAEVARLAEEGRTGARKNVHSMSRSIDDLSHHLNQLRDVCAFEFALRERLIPLRELAASLPGLLHGYLKQIEVGKGLELQIEEEPLAARESIFHYSDILDFILPTLISVLDETIRSGVIKLSSEVVHDRERFVISFDGGMIGHCNVADILDPTFQNQINHAPDRRSGRLALDSIEMVYTVREGGICWIGFATTESDGSERISMTESQKIVIQEQ